MARSKRQKPGERTTLPEGFEIDRIRVIFVGRCPRCRDAI